VRAAARARHARIALGDWERSVRDVGAFTIH
jgi:hypothetical protein